MNADTPRAGFRRRLAAALPAPRRSSATARQSLEAAARYRDPAAARGSSDRGRSRRRNRRARVAAHERRAMTTDALRRRNPRARRRQDREGAAARSSKPLPSIRPRSPSWSLVAGVNGSGKTTTIGKLAARLNPEGKIRDAGRRRYVPRRRDRATPMWAERTGASSSRASRAPTPPASPSRRWSERKREGADVCWSIPPDGCRTSNELMAELEKIVRVLKKQDESAPHAVLLVLDATVGQNALSQVETFREVAGSHRARDRQARRHRQGRHPGGDGRQVRPAGAFRRRRRGDRGSRPRSTPRPSLTGSWVSRASARLESGDCSGASPRHEQERRRNAAGASSGAQDRPRSRAAAAVFLRQRASGAFSPRPAAFMAATLFSLAFTYAMIGAISDDAAGLRRRRAWCSAGSRSGCRTRPSSSSSRPSSTRCSRPCCSADFSSAARCCPSCSTACFS